MTNSIYNEELNKIL